MNFCGKFKSRAQVIKLKNAAENEAIRAERMAAKAIEIQTYAETVQSELEECRAGK